MANGNDLALSLSINESPTSQEDFGPHSNQNLMDCIINERAFEACRKISEEKYQNLMRVLDARIEAYSKLDSNVIRKDINDSGEWLFSTGFAIETPPQVRISMRNQRKPTTPGEILSEEFLTPLGMTQKELADHIGCDVKVINRIVNERTAVTAEMALRLGVALRTSADLWLNAQKAVDLFKARKSLSILPKPIRKVG